jgi:hypothetical protein
MVDTGQLQAALEQTADAPTCDDCLAEQAGVTPQQVAQTCQQRADRGDVDREQGTCTICGKAKIVNSVITSTNVAP